jgi:hypothetical protein
MKSALEKESCETMSDPTTSELTTTNTPSPPPKIHKIHTRQHPLSTEQRLAIELFLLGKTDQQVADAVHLERSTITRWRLYHPLFQTELNRQRQALWLNHADRLRAMAATALDLIQSHLASSSERSSFRAAINILKLAARIAPPIGPTDEYRLLMDYLRAERLEARKYEDICWPPRKQDLDDLRDYLQKKSADLPLHTEYESAEAHRHATQEAQYHEQHENNP